MPNGTVEAICIAPNAGDPLHRVQEVLAIAGQGLEGDRYKKGAGSFSKNEIGRRQVTLMNTRFFYDCGFLYEESRRNLFIRDTELMWLIGREFTIGDARMKGIKYCDPCMRPSKLLGKIERFEDIFHDCGGLVVEVIKTGLIRVGSPLIPPPKGY